jgi:hypothetical protein
LKEPENVENRYVTLYDYMDLDVRVVWAMPQSNGAMIGDPVGMEGSGGVEILREKHDLGFLPWVAKVGGTTLEDDPAHQRIPLLYSVYQAGQWGTQNILETLMASEVIAYASAPRLKVSGPTDEVEVDYGEPGRTAYVPPGHDLSQLAPPGMDVSLAAIADRVSSRIGKSTVPRVLQSGDFPSGTAFATLNLATQSGIKSLTTYKELAEQALADVFTQMLYWVDHSGEALVAYGKQRDDPGQQFVIEADEVNAKNLFIDVELTADVPTDRMARINAASMAVRELGYSRARALEQIGESDPAVIMEEAKAEMIEKVDLEIEKQKRLALGKVEIEEAVKKAQEANNELQGSKPLGQQTMEEMIAQKDAKGKLQGVARGPGFDPARGGSPPAMAAPGMTPEVTANRGSVKEE